MNWASCRKFCMDCQLRRQIFSPMHNTEEKRMASQKQTNKGTKHIFRIVNRKMVLDVHELQRQRAKLQRSDAIFSNNSISRISSYQGITPLVRKSPFLRFSWTANRKTLVTCGEFLKYIWFLFVRMGVCVKICSIQVNM